MLGLKNLEEFSKILSDYQMSADAKRLIESTPYVGLTGITSSGRNTIIGELLKTGRYYYMTSDTTRPPRENNGVMEQDGKEYWFKTEEEVLNDLKSGKYIEAAVIHNQQVSGQNVSEIKIAKDKGLIALNEFDVQGVENIHKITDNLVSIFVLPPSYKVWRERWAKRGEITVEEENNRVESAKKELRNALSKEYYHFLVNDDISKAVKGVEKIVAGEIDRRYEKHGRRIAQEILRDIEENYGK